MAFVACASVIGACVGVYLTHYRDGTGTGAAFNAIAGSQSVALLEAERQQLIAMNAATHVLTLDSKPWVVSASQSSSTGGGGVVWLPPNPAQAKLIARQMMPSFGFSVSGQWYCLDRLWTIESNWIYDAQNPYSGAYGIPQSLPSWKMASAGRDYLTNPATQIRWGLGYIQGRYGTPCSALYFHLKYGYY